MQIGGERLLQSTGKTVLNMVTQGVGAITNIILDPILIFGLFAIKNRYTKYESIVTLKKGRKDFEQKEKFKYDDCEK